MKCVKTQRKRAKLGMYKILVVWCVWNVKCSYLGGGELI